MNRFDRVFSILILLQTKKVITARTIADRFDISDRTVYRDVATLRNAGIPIIGDVGVGYSIMEGYRIPPLMFTEEEASALLTAEKFIGKVSDKETKGHYQSALLKIKAVLRSAEKQSLAILDESIAISDRNEHAEKTYLQRLFRSIAARRILNLQYAKADGTKSDRKVEPIGCYHRGNQWYLLAYCQTREDYRTFKVDRILEMKMLEEQFNTKHISLKDYIDQQEQAWQDEQYFHTIEIAFAHPYVKYAEMRKYYFGFVQQHVEADGVYMTFVNSSLELIARWLMQFADQATVIAPMELRDRVRYLAEEMHDHYQKQYSN